VGGEWIKKWVSDQVGGGVVARHNLGHVWGGVD